MKLTAVTPWFEQRLIDLSLWPINLVRDFPLRTRRLGQSAAIAAQGVLFLLPELIDALRYGETVSWLRYKAGRLLFLGHAVFTQLFDLVGGPEILQIFIRLWGQATPLTGAEQAVIESILGPGALRAGQVRILQGRIPDIVFRFNGNLAFTTWRTVLLPTTGFHTRKNRSILVHELTHVYQYERIGSRYLGEAIYMLIKTKRDCYSYGGSAGLALACNLRTPYSQFNREQQAMIVQDYYVLQAGGKDLDAYMPFIRELRAGQL